MSLPYYNPALQPPKKYPMVTTLVNRNQSNSKHKYIDRGVDLCVLMLGSVYALGSSTFSISSSTVFGTQELYCTSCVCNSNPYTI